MTINRSIERDYDINYACRAAHQAMDDIEEYAKLLVDVEHSPVPLLRALNEQWLQIMEKYSEV
jgi:hypothetical protein